jgi:hypothetical protein
MPTAIHALRQGDEMGRFLLGSTVVLLFPKGPLRFEPGLGAGRRDPHGRGDGWPTALLHRTRWPSAAGAWPCC